MQPETKYAKSGDLHIAYQVYGEGALDLVIVPGFVYHLELQWEHPAMARLFGSFGAFSRVIMLDKRGTGLSDPVAVSEPATLEQRMDDLRAVMDAVEAKRAALLGFWEGGPMCALFAATHPDRTAALVLYEMLARFTTAPDYPWGTPAEALEFFGARLQDSWGQGRTLEFTAPSLARDEREVAWWGRFERFGASPGMAHALWQMNAAIDVRDVLPTIRVPTLVLHRRDDQAVPIAAGRDLAGRIPGARFVELPGGDHLPWVGDSATLVAEVREFLTGVRAGPEPDRILATVLFLDIVGSTERALALGDRRWRDLLADFHTLVRGELRRFGGREIDSAGDGLLAAFDGPARAIRCAGAVRDAVARRELVIRAGVHTGECERLGEKLAGVAVHIGARIAAAGAPGEILVSRVVKDLVVGSGLRFDGRGLHALKGVPGEWQLFAVAA